MNSLKKWSIFVVLPTLLLIGYFAFWASDMYISEAQFSIRSPEGNGSVEWLAIFGQSAGGTAADAYIVQNYIQSSAMLDLLDQEWDIKAHYQNPEADFFSRLKKNPTQEEFTRYFLKRVKVHYDQVAGIFSLHIRAFSPQVAQQLCRSILEKSEGLVNRLRDRAIEDSLALSRNEVARAEQRLVLSRHQLRQFREANNLLDPVIEAGAVQGLVAELEGSAAKVRAELAEARSYMQEDSARIVSLKARIQALEDQVRAEKIRLTGKDPAAVSALAAEYEQLTGEHEFAQKQLISAMSSLEAARIRAEGQSRYLVPFVNPTLPEEALWPRRLYAVAIGFSSILLIFGLGSLIIAAIREHAGV